MNKAFSINSVEHPGKFQVGGVNSYYSEFRKMWHGYLRGEVCPSILWFEKCCRVAQRWGLAKLDGD
jgi:hypothetical protein